MALKGRPIMIVLAAILAAAVLGGLTVAAVRWQRHRSNKPWKVEVPPIPYGLMRQGDLAFRTGRGTYSTMISLTVNSKDTMYYSHVGLVVKEGEEWRIIHAVPGEPDFEGDFERVKNEAPEEFFSPNRCSHGELVHILGHPFPDALAAEAIGYARDSVRFDVDYDIEDTTRLYCTELVWKLYNEAGVDLSEGRRSFHFVPLFKIPVIQPADIWLFADKERYFIF